MRKNFTTILNLQLQDVFSVDDPVLVLNSRGGEKKWCVGKIISVLGALNYKVSVDDVESQKHVDQLLPYRSSDKFQEIASHDDSRKIVPECKLIVEPVMVGVETSNEISNDNITVPYVSPCSLTLPCSI